MRVRFWVQVLILSLLGSVWTPAAAVALGARPDHDKHGAKGHGRHARGEDEGDDDRDRDEHHHHHHRRAMFLGHDRQAVEAYYFGKPYSGLPPGLARGGGNLPPGLEKHLERNGTLPPGLQKRLVPLPVVLERQLTVLPPDCGCQRGFVGSDLVIVNISTGLILDVFYSPR
jgi:Ni/Co efflux regulator RcnB